MQNAQRLYTQIVDKIQNEEKMRSEMEKTSICRWALFAGMYINKLIFPKMRIGFVYQAISPL